MGSWKFKNESYVLQSNNIAVPNAQVSAYKHTDGNIYYLTTDNTTNTGATRSYCHKLTPDGVETYVGVGLDNNSYNTSSVAEAVAVPYHNSVTGYDEVHFVLPKDWQGIIKNTSSTKLIFSPTPTVTMYTPSGTCRIHNVDMGDLTYPSRTNYMSTTFVNGVLHYVYINAGGVYTIQRYNPSSSAWEDCPNAIAKSPTGLVTALFPMKFTTVAIGTKIYSLLTDGNYSPKILVYDTNDSSESFLTPPVVGMLRLQAATLQVGDDIYFVGGQLYGNGNSPAPTIVKWNYVTNIFTDTGMANVVAGFTTANAINTGGELLFVGSYTGGVSTAITKFTYVLSDITGFTANYTPSTSSILLTWSDNAEESFYVVEKKINEGNWESEATLDANVASHTVTGIDIMTNTYSFRIKAGKLAIS